MDHLQQSETKKEKSTLTFSHQNKWMLRAILLSSFVVCFPSSVENLPPKNTTPLPTSKPIFVKREEVSNPRIAHLSTSFSAKSSNSPDTSTYKERESVIYELLYNIERFSTTICWAGYEEKYVMRVKQEYGMINIHLTHESYEREREREEKRERKLEFQDLPPDVYQDLMEELSNQVHTYKEQKSLPTPGHRSSAIG